MADPDVELLGQKVSYPTTWQAAAGVMVVAAIAATCAIWITWIVMVRTSDRRFQGLAALVKTYSKSGELEESDAARMVEFWTPAAATCPSLIRVQQDVHDDQKWQCTATDEKSRLFADALLKKFGDSRIAGYRHWPVTGKGRTVEKDGWWWVLNVSDDFSTKDFVRFYSEYWSNDKKVYIEELGGDRGFR